jgi:hypothetical protein
MSSSGPNSAIPTEMDRGNRVRSVRRARAGCEGSGSERYPHLLTLSGVAAAQGVRVILGSVVAERRFAVGVVAACLTCSTAIRVASGAQVPVVIHAHQTRGAAWLVTVGAARLGLASALAALFAGALKPRVALAITALVIFGATDSTQVRDTSKTCSAGPVAARLTRTTAAGAFASRAGSAVVPALLPRRNTCITVAAGASGTRRVGTARQPGRSARRAEAPNAPCADRIGGGAHVALTARLAWASTGRRRCLSTGRGLRSAAHRSSRASAWGTARVADGT